MAGGFDYLSGGAASLDKFHRIVERSTNNGSSFQVLADFPHGNANGMFEACLVIIDDNTVFLGAGRYGPEYYAETSFLDIASNTWTPGPTLSYKRHGHSCNLVTQQSGDKEIVIVGGIDPARDQDCQVQREVEILNLDTMTVRNASDFPTGIGRHASMYYKDTFLILGGLMGHSCTACDCTMQFSNQIHQYNVDNDTWTEWSVTLPARRDHLSAMFVCPEECELCVDTSPTGNCGLLDVLAVSDISLVTDMCSAGIGIAPFCEKTCDNLVGGFCQ